MKKYKRRGKNYNLIRIFVLLVLFFTFMTVGYSLFTDKLHIEGEVELEPLVIASCNINISDSVIDMSDYSKTISLTYTLENITGDLCTVQYSLDDGTTWTDYTGPFKIYQTTTIKARCIKNEDSSVIGTAEREVKVEVAFFQEFNGDNSLFGITGISKNTITSSISRTPEDLTLADIQARIDNGENIRLISNTASDGYTSTVPVYGWLDASGNFYWWSEAETVYFHPNTVSAFTNYTKVTSIDLSGTSGAFVQDYSKWFWGATGVQTINLNSLDTSSCTNMYGMFYNCQKLQSIDVSSFNTSNVKNMGSMFGNLYVMTGTLELGNFNTSQVTDMANMFNGSRSLTGINVSSFDTSNVKDMGRLFASTKSITEIDVSSFVTSSATNMYGVFSDMSALTTIYAAGDFDISHATNHNRMFNNDNNLVGGNGTVYDANHVNGTYAVIDTPTTPGYFTQR